VQKKKLWKEQIAFNGKKETEKNGNKLGRRWKKNTQKPKKKHFNESILMKLILFKQSS